MIQHLERVLRRRFFESGLSCSQPRNWYTERRATHVVHAHLVAEPHAGGVTPVLTADADLEVLARGTPALMVVGCLATFAAVWIEKGMGLIIPGFIPKMIAIVFVNFCNTGWYPILQGRLYSNLPGQSASIMAIGAVTTPIAKFFPFLIGLVADRFGLHNAMWILLLAPIALLIGLPRNNTHNSPVP